jgi:hypothetical protein
MQPSKKNILHHVIPILCGAMILIPFLLAAGCIGQAPEPRLDGTGWTLSGYLHNSTQVQALSGTTVPLISVMTGVSPARPGATATLPPMR